MFQAAHVALEAAGVGRARWSHPALQAAFTTELIYRRGLYPRTLRAHPSIGLGVRHTADYGAAGVSSTVANRMVRRAAAFVSASRRVPGMVPGSSAGDRRALLDAKLTELVLLVKDLCPAAAVEASALPYEDEDGRVEIFAPRSPTEDSVR
jgi:hypothetical protein